MNEDRATEKTLLMTATQVADLLSISTRSVWRLVASHQLPAPIRYNRKLVRWKRADILSYVERLK